MKKYKILHYIGSLNIGGEQTYLVNLINNLNRSRYDHIIAYSGSDLLKSQIKVQCKFYVLSSKKISAFHLDTYKLFFKFFRLTSSLDLVATYSPGLQTLFCHLAAKIRGIPIIHTIQRPFKNASKWERFMVKFLPLKKFGYSLVNKFVALGEGYFNDQKNLYQIPKHKIFLSYIGIDTKIYGPSEEKRKKFKEDIGIKNNTITLGFVGRLSPEKGLKKVFTLLKHLILHKPSVLLVVVGDGPKREEYKKEVRSLNLQDKVLFVGLRQDIDYVMNGIDIYIQATDNPLNSITSIEALACGKPIITIIRNEEERNMAQDTLIEDFNGLYFNLLEIENSTKKLTTILNPETISRMGKNSLALIKKFDIKQHIKDIEALYTTLGS